LRAGNGLEADRFGQRPAHGAGAGRKQEFAPFFFRQLAGNRRFQQFVGAETGISPPLPAVVPLTLR
jgi:hypothetical protein